MEGQSIREVDKLFKILATSVGAFSLLLGCGGTIGSVVMLLIHNKADIRQEAVPLLMVSILIYSIGILCVVYVGEYKSKLTASAFGFILPIFLFAIFSCSSLLSDYLFFSTGKGLFIPSVITTVVALVSVRAFNAKYRKDV